MAEFSDRLNEALSLRNMKPSELSRITGINEGALSQYRKGAYKASQKSLEKIANALNVPIPWLMGVSDTAEREVPAGYENNQAYDALVELSKAIQAEQPTAAEDDGLSEKEAMLIDFVRRLSDEQVDSLLRFLESWQPPADSETL